MEAWESARLRAQGLADVPRKQVFLLDHPLMKGKRIMTNQLRTSEKADRINTSFLTRRRGS